MKAKYLFLLILSFIILSSLTNGNTVKPPEIIEESNLSFYSDLGWHLKKIDVEGAWEITKGSKNIVVAVLDSGIDFSHPDLTGIKWINTGEVANNSIDDDVNGYVDDMNGWDFVSGDNIPGPEDLDPIHWHATFIAGIIAAPADNYGVAGVAPNVTVMDIRVLQADNYAGTTYEGFGDSIRYAVDNGADVISMSLQYYGNNSEYYDDIQYAYENNVALVSITGNNIVESGGGLEFQSFPGGYDEVISVGATNFFDEKADYSNYGSWTELVAPVGDQEYDEIDHLIQSCHTPYDLYPYYYGYGTSFACPQVAGVIALMKSLKQDLSNDEVREILNETAIDLGDPGKDDFFGYGMVNASAAVEEVFNRYGYPETTLTTETTTPTSAPYLTIIPLLAMIITLSKKKKN